MTLQDFQKWAYGEANAKHGIFPKECVLTEDSALELATDLSELDMFLNWQGQRTWGKHHPIQILESMKNGTAKLLNIQIVVKDDAH